MTKVFLISNTNAQDFENNVNAFIQDKKVIDIKYQAMNVATAYASYVPVELKIIDRALIIYEEK